MDVSVSELVGPAGSLRFLDTPVSKIWTHSSRRLEGMRIGEQPHWRCGAPKGVAGSSPVPSARQVSDSVRIGTSQSTR